MDNSKSMDNSRPTDNSRPINNKPMNNTSNHTVVNTTSSTGRVSSSERPEKSFEELALLASSIVMIAIHDDEGKIIGSGSGIMIGRDGYILTNNHVARGGSFYSVRIEDEEETYPTDEVIKYNYNLDLAVIRIDRKLTPLTSFFGPL